MSEPKSPLAGAKYEGFVKLATMGLQGMITLRGDLGSEALEKAVKAVTGVDVPAQRRINLQGEAGAAWMSPDELLLLVPYADVAAALERLHDMLAGTHFLAVDVSDARVMFRLEGQGVREVVAKLMPVDMRKEAFGEGEFRRSRMAQIPAAIWMPGVDRVQIICFRSVAEYAFNLLKGAAAPGGEVGHLA
jgi:sarcosine oxidase subunit gamma